MAEGYQEMAINKILIYVLLFICLAAQASSQGYMGTVTTGTGIVPPLTVGKSTSLPANVGASASLENLTGSWSVDLKGPQIRHLDLQMFQESDLILGTGMMNTGDINLPVVAAGSVTGNMQTIFISFIDKSEVFRLVLSVSRTAFAGKYESLSAAGVREQGTVIGSIILETKQSNALGESTNPSLTTGAWVGKSAQSLNEGSSTGHLTEKRSVYKTSTGQGIATLDDNQVTTSFG
jgi:hypothetical protein